MLRSSSLDFGTFLLAAISSAVNGLASGLPPALVPVLSLLPRLKGTPSAAVCVLAASNGGGAGGGGGGGGAGGVYSLTACCCKPGNPSCASRLSVVSSSANAVLPSLVALSLRLARPSNTPLTEPARNNWLPSGLVTTNCTLPISGSNLAVIV